MACSTRCAAPTVLALTRADSASHDRRGQHRGRCVRARRGCLKAAAIVRRSRQLLPSDASSEAEQARNLTLAILSIPQPDRNVSFAISANSSLVTNVTLVTDFDGEIDSFVPLNSTGLPSGAGDGPITRLDVQVAGDPTLGNSSLFLVPQQGYTLVSDIDDMGGEPC